MKTKKIIIAFFVEYVSLTILSLYIVTTLGTEYGTKLFFCIETLVDFALLMYLLLLSKELIKNSATKLFASAKNFFGNIFVLLTMYIMTFLVVAISSTYLNMNNLDNYNEVGIEAYLQISQFISIVKIVIIAPIIEEIVFRGAIYGKIREKSLIGANIISGLLFGFMHVWMSIFKGEIMSIINIIPYIALGLGISITYERTKNFIYPVVFHMIHNGLMLAMSLV